jgi:hypothetical protein
MSCILRDIVCHILTIIKLSIHRQMSCTLCDIVCHILTIIKLSIHRQMSCRAIDALMFLLYVYRELIYFLSNFDRIFFNNSIGKSLSEKGIVILPLPFMT